MLTVQSLEQAAQWYATLRDESAGEAERVAWQKWLARSPEHQAAWTHIENVSRKFDPLRGYGQHGATAAVSSVDATRQTAARRRTLTILGGAVGAGVLSWLGWEQSPLPELLLAARADYHTGAGERRDLMLADGTRVWLNTRTALQVDYQDSRRSLILLGGEILIQTAPDSRQRPFYVDTIHGRLQALGTRFTVRQTDDMTRLDVFDGEVEIRTGAGKTMRVHAGQAAEFDARNVSPIEPAERMREAWSRGVLPADNLPLGRLLDELGRYRRGYLQVTPEAAALRVMGVYPADDPDRALSMLEQSLPIRVRRTLPWWITVDLRADAR